MANNLELISGRVTAVSNKKEPGGVKIEGYENWFNLSKYEKSLVLPSKGDVVTLGVGQDGYVRTIEWTERTTPQGPAGAPGGAPVVVGPASVLSPEQAIRAEALKIAAMFCGTRQEATTDHVVLLAKTWEKFIADGTVPTRSTSNGQHSANGHHAADAPAPELAPAG